jgi:poly(beta-D-mannuronate) lyase
MKLPKILLLFSVITLSTLALFSCGISNDANEQRIRLPGEVFDLTDWKISLPIDGNNDGKGDSISQKDLQTYQHSDYFYLDDQGYMVFTAPNKASTSPTSTNTRSEMRHMLGSDNNDNEFANDFSLKSNKRANKFAQIGGNLQATVRVNHVAKRAKYIEKPTAFSVVVGQIHATKNKMLRAEGYGYGNEPLKIYYKKLPNHEYGSVFWNYERNLEKGNPDRIDISYPVWGKPWLDMTSPGEQGIALDEAFSYEVNVYENTMYLTFRTARHGKVNYEINLANNVDAYGKVDELDHPKGYVGDATYFKAGAYNQCSIKDDPSFRYPACPGSGDWATDKANGDYSQVTFMRLVTAQAYEPKK